MTDCTFDGCDRPMYTSAGLCNPHYQQRRANKPLTPVRRRSSPGTPAVRDDQGRKHCTRCDRWKPPTEFAANAKASDQLLAYCRSCMRESKYQARYGVTAAEVEDLERQQDGRCAICEQFPAEPMVVDHDHSHCTAGQGCPECIRGLLCRSCNTALGLLGDDPDRLTRAAAYLRRRRTQT